MEQREKKILELRLKGEERRWEESAKKDPGISEHNTENQDLEEINEIFEEDPHLIVS